MIHAVLLALAAEGVLTLMDAFIKTLTARYPVLEITFLRFAAGSVWAALLCAVLRPDWPSREAIGVNAGRSVLVVVTAGSFFYALSQLPLGEAMALSFLSPLFMALFGALFLRETLDGRIVAALALGLLGMMVIVGGKFGTTEYTTGALWGAGAVVISAITYALATVLLRARATRDALSVIVLIQNVGPMLILALPVALVWTAPAPADLAYFALIGLLGVAGHVLFAAAFARAEAARLAPVHYATLLWGIVFGYVFFGEVPGLVTCLGAGLIVLGTLTIRKM